MGGLGKEAKLLQQRRMPAAELKRARSNQRLQALDAADFVGRVGQVLDGQVEAGLIAAAL